MKKIMRNSNICSIHTQYIKNRLVCKHIDNMTCSNIIILDNGDVLCQKCYNKINDDFEFVFLCSKCVKYLVDKFISHIKQHKLNVSDYIIGYDNLNIDKGKIDE